MKNGRMKFSIFCLVIFAIVRLPTTQLSLKSYMPIDVYTYTFYTTDSITEIPNATIINNGTASIVSCLNENALDVRKSICNLLGESVSIKNPSPKCISDVKNFIDKKVKFTEEIDGTKISYAYDSTLQHFIIVDDQKINIQVAQSKDCLVIGYPLILGSF